MEKLSQIVGRTLGPGGLPILIERKGLDSAHKPLKPLVTKELIIDLKPVKSYELHLDKFENFFIKNIKIKLIF